MAKYNLKEILPHNPPMILLDDIVEYDLENETLCAEFYVYPEKMFFDETINGINSLSGIEFMAQTIGCYSYFKEGKAKPKPGLLLGTRLYNNAIEKFENNSKYRVKIHQAYSDDEIYAFDCMILNEENKEVQSACLKVFKSENIEEMLKL